MLLGLFNDIEESNQTHHSNWPLQKIPEHTIMLFFCHPKILHKHFLQFLLGVKIPPRETEENAYAKFWNGVVNRNYTLFKTFVRFWLAQILEYILDNQLWKTFAIFGKWHQCRKKKKKNGLQPRNPGAEAKQYKMEEHFFPFCEEYNSMDDMSYLENICKN